MANLKNGYKVLYENRKIEAGVADIKLKATKTIPAATDANIIYKNEEGTEIDPKAFKLIVEKNGSLYGSTTKKAADATKFILYSGEDIVF